MKEKLGDYKLEFYDEDSFYVNTVDKDGKYCGKVRISVNVTPGEHAKSNPVGNGRTEPNQSPYLPPPVGRISFSLNPFTMLVRIIIYFKRTSIELISWPRNAEESILVLLFSFLLCVVCSLHPYDFQ